MHPRVRGSVAASALLALALLAHLSTSARAQSTVDGVFDDGLSGSTAFQGGETTEEASASNKAVPEPEGVQVPSEGYFRQLADWFLTWMNHNGVDTSAVEVNVTDDSSHSPWKRPQIKLRAARGLKKGETIFRLPVSMQVSSHAILYDYPLYTDPTRLNSTGWTGYSAVASWILRERHVDTGSPWAPYLRLLPPYVSLPIFFPDPLVLELQFQPLIETVQGYREAIEEEYRAMRGEALSEASLEEFFWAVSMVMSRAFDGPTDPVLADTSGIHSEAPTMLLPLADLMDHSNHYNVESHVDADGAFVFTVNKDVEEGEELWNQYGLKNTDFLLLSYGFVLDPNEQDSVKLVDRKTGARDVYKAYYVTEQNPFGAPEDSWALYVSNKADAAAVEAAREEREKLEDLFGPKYDLGYPEALNAWQGGLVDPPLLAGLASTVFYFSFGREPEYHTLARLSVWYGWYLYSGTCAELAAHVPMTEDELQSFVSAATGVKLLVDSMLQQLPTTVADDENIVHAMMVCKAGGDPVERDPDMKHYCESLSSGDISPEERELVVRARLAKKRILKDLSHRLETTCAPGMKLIMPPPPVDARQSTEHQSSSESLQEHGDDTDSVEDKIQAATGKKTVADGDVKIEISTSAPTEEQGEKKEVEKKKKGWWS